MYITLIRDKVPANAEAEGVSLNHAVIKNDSLFIDLLRDKLIESVNAFLQSGSFESLAETQVVVEALSAIKPEYKDIYNAQLEQLGRYDEHYMYVQLDSNATPAKSSETEDPQTEPEKPLNVETNAEN